MNKKLYFSYLQEDITIPFNEYEIILEGITLLEAKELLKEANEKKVGILKRLKDRYQSHLKVIIDDREKALKEAGDNPEKIPLLKKHFGKLIDRLGAAYKTSVDAVNKSYENTANFLKKSLIKPGAKGFKVSNLTTKGKVGLAAAAVGGIGYAAYKLGE